MRLPAATVLAAILIAAAAAAAAPRPAAAGIEDWHPRLDIEPAAWFLHGYSVHVGFVPPAVPRLVLSTGAYAFDVPGLLVDLASGNRDEPWDVRLYLGAGVFADYFVGGPVDRGWMVGAQLGFQRTRATLETPGAATETDDVTRGLILVRAGYEWHPGDTGAYLFPWIGAAITPKLAGDPGSYDSLPVTPYVTVDLGWRL